VCPIGGVGWYLPSNSQIGGASIKEGGIVTRIISWKKLVVLVAIGALVLVLAVPAMAIGGFVEQDTEQDGESGEADQGFDVSGSGNSANQCAGIQGVAQTGNAQNEVALTQYRARTDEFNLEEVGSDIVESPESSTKCEQGVDQAASASGDNPATGGNPVKKKK
jgi:hypothetical protein